MKHAVGAMTPEHLFEIAYRLGTDSAAERELDAWLSGVTPREAVALAAAARVSFRHGVWRTYVPLDAPIPAGRLDEVAPRHPLAVAALLSTHRSGYVRELALARLVESTDDRGLPFLLLRTDDIVPVLRSVAEHAVQARVRTELAPALARSLGLLEVLRRRARGGRSLLVRRVDEVLGDPACRPALVAASADDEPLVRRKALALRLRGEPASAVLAVAAADADTGVRLWAARTTFSRETTDYDKRALLPLFEGSRSAWARSLALRARARLDPTDAPIEAALLDPHGAVRRVARVLLRARHPERDFGGTRARALAVLADPAARPAAVVGALGALADVGLAVDAPLAAALASAESAPRRVRAEAERTAKLLGA